MSREAWLGLAIVLLSLGGGYAWMKTRGLRNNNPGNIRDTGTNWKGLDTPRNDGAYLRFVSPEYGIRALARILHNYQARHRLNTIRAIISRWAPASENDTNAYVADVAQRVGVGPDEPISVDALMPKLVAAIIHHENGMQPYGADTIARGIAMARA